MAHLSSALSHGIYRALKKPGLLLLILRFLMEGLLIRFHLSYTSFVSLTSYTNTQEFFTRLHKLAIWLAEVRLSRKEILEHPCTFLSWGNAAKGAHVKRLRVANLPVVTPFLKH